MTDRELKLRHLRSRRPRSRFAHWSGLLLLAVMSGSWFVGDFHLEDFLSQRRLQNLGRFLNELVPYPLQGRDFDVGIAFQWSGEVLAERGWSATVTTLAISVAAIVLAGFGGALFSLPAARELHFAGTLSLLVAKSPPGLGFSLALVGLDQPCIPYLCAGHT